MKKWKCCEHDITEADMPETRRQVFVECYTEQFSTILQLGFTAFIMTLPVLSAILWRDSSILRAATQDDTHEQLIELYKAANFKFGAIIAVAISLSFGLFSGVIRVLRQLVWREPIFYKEDMRIGWTNDLGSFFLISFFAAATSYLLDQLSASILTYMMWGFYVVVILPVMIWMLLQTVYYRVGTLACIRNAVRYYLRTVPQTLLLLLCSALPFWIVLTLIPYSFVKYLVLILLVYFYVIPMMMVWLLYACYIFDDMTNATQYPQIYRRGLRPKIRTESNDIQ